MLWSYSPGKGFCIRFRAFITILKMVYKLIRLTSKELFGRAFITILKMIYKLIRLPSKELFGRSKEAEQGDRKHSFFFSFKTKYSKKWIFYNDSYTSTSSLFSQKATC